MRSGTTREVDGAALTGGVLTGWVRRVAVGGLVLLVVSGSGPHAPALSAAGAGAWSVMAQATSAQPDGAHGATGTDTGTVVTARALPGDGMFALAYVHSAYHAPTVEVFRAAGRRFTMYAVASPNEAVLDYYAVAGPRSASSGWWVLRLDAPQVFDELPLIATPVGRRTLVTGRDCVPLYPASGAYDLSIRIIQGRPATRPVGRSEPCPSGVIGAVHAASSNTKPSPP